MHFRTTSTLNLQPIRLLTSWPDEPPGSRGDLDSGRPAKREDILCLEPTDSPVSPTNLWDRAVTQLAALSVCNSGGERVPKTPPNVNEERSCVTQYRGDTSSRVYDGEGERVPETQPNMNDR